MPRNLLKVRFSFRSISALILLITLTIQCGKDDDTPQNEEASQDTEEQTNNQTEDP